jgi:hypothetical protein
MAKCAVDFMNMEVVKIDALWIGTTLFVQSDELELFAASSNSF